MATAKFCDRYESTLSSGYTSGGGSLVVTSAGSGDSTLPTAGDFYVKVEAEGANTEEVFLCTSRSGTTLTVTGAKAGTSASNHASTAVIKGVVLAAGTMKQARIDTVRSLSVSAQAALSGDEQFGTMHLTDGPYTCVWNGSSWDYYYQGYKCTPVIDGDYAWVNQGTSTVSTSTKALYLETPSGSNAWGAYIRKKSLGSLPITYTMAMKFNALNGAGVNTHCGLVLRESSSGKLYMFHQASTGGFATWSAASATSTPNGILGYTGASVLGSGLAFLRVTVDVTNKTFYYSSDGRNWLEFSQVTLANSFTTGPDEIGFYICPWNAVYRVGATILSWIES